ncbi:MAG TPA: hypothetical protein VJ464_01450 [Blastocatellia bacterium]|nr:hypothetical protein [Blastocatellia bacterium]
MVSEKTLVRALDLLTVAPKGEVESLRAGGPGHVKEIRRVIDSKNIVAVGISEKVSAGRPTGNLAITFYVERKIAKNKLKGDEVIPPALPEVISGPQAIPTDVIVIGRPQLEVQDLASPLVKRTPIQPGFSIGHVKVTAGTLGAIVKQGDQLMLLSNCHVLANSGKARKGDKILYPGDADEGRLPDDLVGELADFVKFKTGGDFVNRVDCAVAIPLPARLAEVVAEIKGLGIPKGVIKPKRGMKVTKVGRTTGKSTGTIKDVNFRMTLNYPGVGEVGFLDQVFCSRYTNNGDSGSIVIDNASGKAVGLHFAGYPDQDGVKGSVFNPIDAVLDALKVKLVTTSI